MVVRVMVRVAFSLDNRAEHGKHKLFVGVSINPIPTMVVDHMVGGGGANRLQQCGRGYDAQLCRIEEALKGSGGHKLVFFHRSSNELRFGDG
jgi:hypothetical protein